MKKIAIILAVLFLISFLSTSCRKAKEPEGRKEAQVQQEVKQQPETKPEVQPQLATPTAKEEKPSPMEPSPLTEEEQKEFEKIGGGGIPSPNLFKSKKDALIYLKILLKGDEKTIRWYVDYAKDEDVVKGKYMQPSLQYSYDICTALNAIALKREEAFDLIVEVMKRKADYPKAYSCASEKLRWYAIKEGKTERVKSAILLLKEAVKNSDSKVRLEAAGALLASGEADIALPVLDALAKKGEVRALFLLYEPEDRQKGEIRFKKLWDNRGVDIFRKAMEYPSDEVKGYAANALTKLGMEKEKTEAVSLNIVKKLMYKTQRDYGFETINPLTNPKDVLLPGYEGKDIWELREKFSSDHRACNFAIYALGRLKSKKAVPLLQYIKENNTESDKGCWEDRVNKPAENALGNILENGGDK